MEQIAGAGACICDTVGPEGDVTSCITNKLLCDWDFSALETILGRMIIVAEYYSSLLMSLPVYSRCAPSQAPQ